MKPQIFRQLLCLIVSALGLMTCQQTFASQRFYVNNTRVNLRSSPTASRENILGTLERDTELEMLSKQGRWLRVRSIDGREGWVSEWVLASKDDFSDAKHDIPQPKFDKPRTDVLSPEKVSRTGPVRTGSSQDMIFIPGGTTIVGSTENEIQALVRQEGISEDMLRDERPQKNIVYQGFYIDRYEVTNAEYKHFVDAARYQPPLNWEGDNYPTGTGTLPVTFISWDDAHAYAEWAGKRLPTSEEWEIASRGPDAFVYPWGESSTGRNLNINRRQNGPAEVGSYANDLSAYGVNDMGGNVMEWTASHYAGSENFFILKGSSWVGKLFEARGANKTPGEAIYQLSHIGFRCAKDAE
ncbi:hypothetical protein CSB45_13855 [candidate division KSB3 bacterium]|uniref:SH3b domain-containing protein n=1 Tax=candidate division KSB3 bacterium TaxID=2044937 RepID=A0A2G6E1I0_9BACT|nr:MAG: hypothetical protein CSB45_13855 [candidate division KSB3 bacterium]PIE28507.1 MAG: hypothetical protein CSA57_13460 [candidate division KSB3 bacterium]